MAINPVAGATAAGQALALPLTAASCQAGTAAIDSQIITLGGTPGGGIGSGPAGGGISACPAGDAEFTLLLTTIGGLSQADPRHTWKLLRHENELISDSTLVAIRGENVPAITALYSYDGFGTPLGVVALNPPGAIYALVPSGTAGTATVACTFCGA